MPLDEAGPWAAAADSAGVETILLAAPTTTDERLPRICERSRGFVYAVGLLGVTGLRDDLADSATVIAGRCKQVTDAEVIEAFQLLSRTEGIIPALEPAHALAWMSRARDELAGKTVLLNMSGRGDKDAVQMMEILG